jgi:hypothetical protein
MIAVQQPTKLVLPLLLSCLSDPGTISNRNPTRAHAAGRERVLQGLDSALQITMYTTGGIPCVGNTGTPSRAVLVVMHAECTRSEHAAQQSTPVMQAATSVRRNWAWAG